MKDCSLTISVKDDVVNYEGQNISMVDLAMISGLLQIYVGQRGIILGLELDSVKNNMLGIYQDAMIVLENQVCNGLIKVGTPKEKE